MLPQLPAELREIVLKGSMSSDDVLTIRKCVYGDATIQEREADWLFALNRACPDADGSFAHLFREALADFVVHQMQPAGYVSEDNASWLMTRIRNGTHAGSFLELDLLVHILQKSASSPKSLATFALREIRDAVLKGDGPLGARRQGTVSRIDATDVDLIMRILFAFGSEGNIAVTREEAELLFELNDATKSADNDPAWSALFAKGIANHVMMAVGYPAPSREEAMKREVWETDHSVNVSRFFSRMVSGLKEAIGARSTADLWAEQNAARDADIKLAEVVTETEAQWLAGRLNRGGTLSGAEQALLIFIKAEARQVHPVLKPLLDKVA